MVCLERLQRELGRPYSTLQETGVKAESYKAKAEMEEGGEGVGGAHSSDENRDNITLFEQRGSALTDVSSGRRNK
ncbi:MAG: hypothetical protein HY776_04015 [Actinobacteria bacterium]|nr:hypothetical protein [Actinomycetota bacterium]